MKDYFTTKDRVRHIFIVGLKPIIEDLAHSDALTPEESRNLTLAANCIGKANDSILERLGAAYRKKILAMNRDNKIDLISRYGTGGITISNVASEDIEPALEELRSWKCIGCTKDDFKDCAVYNMCIACDCEIKQYKDGKGCPYNMFINEEEEL